jgi:hypothetical protein
LLGKLKLYRAIRVYQASKYNNDKKEEYNILRR